MSRLPPCRRLDPLESGSAGWIPCATHALVVLLTAAVALNAQTRNVVVISHRGEHLHHPENTMPAFEEAARVGADYIEVDVRTTSDGKLVLMHDATVDRTTNGHGEVSKMSFDEIRALDAGIGAKVPTFDEALDFARGKVGIYVDVKQVSARELVDHIVSHGMADHVVIYSGRISKDIRELNPRLKIMPEARDAEFAQKLVDSLHPKVLAFDAHDFKPEVIEVAKKAHALIYVDRLGSADTAPAWQEAIDWGADGIQTDHPEELVEYLRGKGYSPKRK
jgi:glycerophosphoryl diester phosphodiesterase